FYPLSAVAACILLAVVIAVPFARDGAKTADNSVVETQDFKEKTTTYSSKLENYLADSSLSYVEDGMAAGGTLEEESSDVARLLHCLKLTHKNGENLTKAEYEAECKRLCSLGYDAHVYENDGGIKTDSEICILLALLSGEEFSDTEYNFELTLVTE
ncbi:MAG: hypothetical protein II982_03540, partial [Clostridia bacterium]|nr:hypothetical protein [Clostridia bacterium]